MIKNIKRVSGFLGSKGIPVPISDDEIKKILGQMKKVLLVKIWYRIQSW